MQRIIKNTVAGERVIDLVLSNAWCTLSNRYEGNIYYGLIDNPSRTQLIRLFLTEQHNKCCYCLREIPIDEVTIEHIVPQRVTVANFPQYLTVPELSASLIHKDNFDRYILMAL